MRTVARFLALFGAIQLLAAPGAQAAPWTSGNADWNVNLEDEAIPANYYGAWSGHTYFPSPDDWRKIPIYQLITDRWNDGQPENNELDYGGYDLTSVGTRHGGDFLGVSNKLEYIRALGYKGVWISPVFQNRDNSYHGYGQIDFTLLDKRFGTVADFRAMVNKAHELGLYVIVDIVVNHISDLYYFEGYPSGSAPFKLHSGEYNLIQRTSETYVDFPVVNTKYETGQYCDVYGDDGYVRSDSGAGSFWDSDLHHNGDLGDYGDPWQNHLGKIYGTLDDVRTTHPRVQGKITAMTKALIASCDVDGIRMDTPMQVPRYFFENWCTAVKAYAATLGKDDFFIFGEFYCSRERAVTMVGRGRTPAQYGDPYSFINSTYTMDGGINYRIYFDFFQPAVKDQTGGSLRNALTGFQTDMNNRFDFYDPVRSEVRYTHLNFYNNHDQWRMIHNPGGYAEGVKKTDLGSAILAFFPGIPLFYYGDEQGFCTSGTALDGWSREDFMTSLAWNNVSALVSPNPAIKDNFDMCHPQYLYVQKCMNIRDKYPALQATDTVHERWAQDGYGNNGIFAFTRAYGANVKDWALVAFNTWDSSLEAGGSLGDFWTGWNASDVIVNALNPAETYTLATGGELSSLWVGPFETKVFVRQDNLKALNPVVTNVYPAHDARVSAGADTVKIQFSEAMDGASVTNAFRYDGKRVAASALTWNGTTRELSYSATITEGIHTIEILTNAVSSVGNGLYGAKFRSRFRCGTDQNIIANAAATSDSTLINNGAASTTSRDVTLYHKATGAEKLRVKNADGVWGNWQTYAATTALTLPEGDGTKSLQVQYWADGSGAYYVSDNITLGEGGCTVTLVQQTGNYNASYDNSGGAFDPDGVQMGMWANGGGAKQTVRWRNFRTQGGSGGNNRNLQIGDVFKITVSATRAYGQIGLSLNASGTQGSSWDNRISGSRLYANTDNFGAWYVNRSGGNTTFGAGYNPIQGTYKDYAFTFRITSETTADAYLTVDGSDYHAYNLTMNGSAGTNINAYSVYLADDWDGGANQNIYWKQNTSVENSKRVELGYWLASGDFNPGKVTDGLDACDGTTLSVNAVYIGGNSGTSVTLDDANTFTGPAIVNENATAKAQNATAFGTTAGGVTVTSGGRIQLSGGITIGAEALTLSGTGISDSGALQNTSGHNAWGGNVALASNAMIASDSGTLTIAGTVDMGGANGRTLAIAGSGGMTLNGNIINAAGGADILAKSGSGTLTLGNIATDPELMFNHSGGIISISTAGAIGGPTGYSYPDKFNFRDNATLALSSGTVTLGRYVSNGDRVGFVITAGKTATFDVASGATLTIDGKITQTASGGALTKSSAGTLILSQTNEYSGATTVSGGKLVVNGSIANSTVSVASGATLAGTGTVGPIASLAGTISPGNSVGTLSVNGSAALGGGTYDCEIASTSPTDCDLIEASGAVAAASTFTVNLPAAAPPGFNGNTPYYWVIASGSSANDANMVLGTTWTAPGTFDIEQWGDTIVVTYTTPTRVVLYNFSLAAENGVVVARWHTASESETVGFYLERQEGNAWMQVNSLILYARGQDGLGAAYALVDPGAVPGGTYVYRLIELESDGNRQIHGPFQRTAAMMDFTEENPIATTDRGVLLRWLSRADEYYRILRSTNLLAGKEGFRPIATGIPATPPENEYLDEDAGRIGMYLIQSEEE